jgi:MFS family permease
MNLAAVNKYFQEFSVIKRMRREYWGVQAINLLDNFYGFAFGMVGTIFMSKTLGFSDFGAGKALSLLGIFTSVFLFASGPIVDWLGLKKSLLISIVFVIFVRSGMAITAFWPVLPHHEGIQAWLYGVAHLGSPGFAAWFDHVAWRPIVYITCLGLGGLPVSVKNTAYHIGNKWFSPTDSQGAGFNLWYIIMNVSALAAGFYVDWQRSLNVNYSWFVVLGVVTGIITLFTTWLLIRDERSSEEIDTGVTKVKEEKVAYHGAKRSWWMTFILSVWNKLKAALTYTKMVVREPSFWRMMTVVTLNLGVSAVFIYWSMISPKYWDRVIGPEAAIGKLSAINPFIIIVGLIALVPIIDRFKTFSMLTWGSFIAAASLIPLVIPWYWVSANPTTAYYTTSIVSMVVFSFGEMMFSPRLSQYILAVAPTGQEGIYSSFAALPSFVRSTVVGFTSGLMLTIWCPEMRLYNGTMRPLREIIESRTLPYWNTPEAMWLILTAAAIVGPICMVLMRKWLVRGLEAKV